MIGPNMNPVFFTPRFRPSSITPPSSARLFMMLLLCASLVTQERIQAQADWTNQIDFIGDDDAQKLAYDATGQFFYVAGAINIGTINTSTGGLFGVYSNLNGVSTQVNIAGYGGKDGYLAKYSSSGVLQWYINLGSSGDDEATGVAVGSDGNIYITGYYSSNAFFPSVDGNPTTLLSDEDGSSRRDGFIASYTPNGDSRWARSNGGEEQDYVHSVCALNGAIVVVGSYDSDGDTEIQGDSPNDFGGNDMYIARYSNSGTSQWFISGGTPADDYLGVADFRSNRWSICTDGTNIYALTTSGQGGYHTYNTSDNLSSSHNFSDSDANLDLVIHCLSQTGNIQWVKPISCPSRSVVGFGITANSTGLYVTSAMHQLVTWPDGSTTSLGANNSDIVVARLRQSDGSRVWDRRMQGTTAGSPVNIPLDMTLSKDSAIFIAGRYKNAMAIDATNFPTPSGANDGAFAACFSKDGSYLKGTSSGGTGNINALSIDCHPFNNNLIVCGGTKVDLVSGMNILNFSEDAHVHSLDLLNCNSMSILTSTVSNDTICLGSSIDLNATATIGTLTWQSSLTAASFTDISAGGIVTVAPLESRYYRAKLSYSGCPDIFSPITFVKVDTPQTADAGNDIFSCTDTLIISGNSPMSGNTGRWRYMVGTAQIEDPYSTTTRIYDMSNPVTIGWVINSGACGLSTDVIQITSDASGPNFPCLTNQSIYVGSDCKSYVPDYTAGLIGTDNCTPSASITYTQTPAAGTEINGTVVRSGLITAMDLLGNTSTCSFSITTVDTISPTIVCPPDTSVLAAEGQCSQNITLRSPQFADNCNVETIHWWLSGATSGASSGNGINILSDYDFAVGYTQVNYIVRDASGNAATCQYMVRVIDLEKPEIICADSVFVNTITDSCFATITSLVPTITDNCGIAYWHNSYNNLQDAGGDYFSGTHEVIWLAGDFSFNENTCTTTVVVSDIQIPTIICPPSIDTATTTGSCFVHLTLPIATATDNCPGWMITNDYNGGGSFVAGNFYPGSTVIQYEVVDYNNNTSTCTTTVNVVDSIAPIINCIPNVYSVANTGLCSDTVTVPTPMITAVCGTFTLVNDWTSTNNASDLYPVGTTDVLWTVTDIHGNDSTCITKVQVAEIEPPVVICPHDTIIYSTTTTCNGQMLINPMPTYFDNCGIDTAFSDHPSNIYPIGFTTVNWVVRDVHGNNSTCSYQIQVIDTIKPNIICPIDREFNTSSSDCTRIVPTIGTPIVSDNCGMPTFFNDHPNTTYSLGETEVTWTVIDQNGNANSCVQVINIEDETDPIIQCPPNITVNTDANSCVATISSLGVPSITWDNCTIDTIFNDHPSLTFPKGTTMVTWTIRDEAGNEDTSVQQVMVNDNTPPQIICPSDTVVQANNGCQSVATLSIPSISDNCTLQKLVWQLSGATTGISPLTGFNYISTYTFNPGITYVTYLLKDTSGNQATCTFTVTVSESVMPTIACPPAQTYYVTEDECFVEVLPAMTGTATATDNCGTAITWSDFLGGNLAPGDFTIHWYAQDLQTNIAICDQIITVLDTIVPIIDCPSAVTAFTADGLCESYVDIAIPAVIENCSILSFENDYTATSDASGMYPGGMTTVIWRATDINGRTGVCTTSVIVNDLEIPTIICPNDTTFQNTPGECKLTTLHIGDPIVNDNCGIQETFCDHPSVDYPIGTTAVLWTTVDYYGNPNTCTQLVTVSDDENPHIDCPDNIALQADSGICGQVISQLDLGVPVVDDNCGILNWANNHPSEEYPVGLTLVEWTVTDIHGLTNSCNQEIWIEDNTDPIIICPSDTIIHADTANCRLWLTSIPGGIAEAFDDCGIIMLQNDFNFSVPYFPGDYEVHWTAYDPYDNYSSCTQYFTIEDITLPEIICPDTIIRYLDSSCSYEMEDIRPLVAHYDNCTDDTLLTFHQQYPIGMMKYDPHEFTMQLEVTDLSGNVTGCQSLFILLDTIAPVIICPADQIIATDNACEGLVPDYTSLSYSDECSSVTITQSPAVGTPFTSNITVTLTATDTSGNSSSCEFEVITADIESPEITVTSTPTLYSDESCQVIVPDLSSYLTISDNCTTINDLSIQQIPAEGDTLNNFGLPEIIFIVTDAAGNHTSDTITVAVTDTIAPYIDCPEPQYLALGYDCEAYVPDYSSIIWTEDACSIVTFEQIPAAGESLDAGEHDIQIIASDDSGNSDTCHFSLVVEDISFPSIYIVKTVNISTSDVFTYMTPDGDLIVDDAQASLIEEEEAFPCSYYIELPEPFNYDNCGIQSSVNNYTGTNNASGFYPVGYTAIEWAVTDIHGNTTYDVVDLTVHYDEPIAVMCPSDTTVSNLADSCSAWITLQAPVAAGHCIPITYWNDYTNSDNSSGYYDVGTHVIQWEISDTTGNAATCIQTVEVIDVQAPIVICPPSDTIQASALTCTVNYSAPDPIVIENCTITTSSWNIPSANFSPAIYYLTYTATDQAGLTGSCDLILVVEDVTIPETTCPEDTVIYLTTDACETIYNEVASGMDHCSSYIIESNHPSTEYAVGIHEVIWTITDGSNNMNSCTQIIEVQDTIVPIIDCISDVSYTITDDALAANVTIPTPNTSDNCNYTFENSFNNTTDASGNYSIGETTVIWSIADANGNSASCVTTVNVVTTFVPYLICPQDTLVYSTGDACGASIEIELPLTNLTTIVNDYNGGENVSGYFPVAFTNVIWQGLDNFGVLHTCTTQVNVLDSIAPIVVCPQDTTIELQVGSCAIEFTPEIPSINDACGVDYFGWDAVSYNLTLGNHIIQFGAVDTHGNTTTCERNIQVVDLIIPEITCPADTILYLTDSACHTNYIATATGNDFCSTYTLESDHPNDDYTVGVHTIQWEITDASGNTNQCSQLVEVRDSIIPTIICFPLATSVITDDALTTFVEIPSTITADNCNFTFENSYNQTTDASDVYPIGQTAVVWTITDENGNTNTCTTLVEVSSTFTPYLICPQDTVIYTNDVECGSHVELPLPFTNLTGAFNDFNNTENASGYYPVGTTSVIWQANDNNYLLHTCTTTVEVLDTIAPWIVCPQDTVIEIGAGECSIAFTGLNPIMDDACGIASFGWDSSVYTFTPGLHTIHFHAEDIHGNISTCSRNIQVVDLIQPVIACPNDTIVYVTATTCEAEVVIQAIASDNCINYEITSNTSDFNFAVGSHQIIWTITDASLNSNTCQTVVTVLDTILPTINCASEVVMPMTSDQMNIWVPVPQPLVDDNCLVSFENDYNQSEDASDLYSEGIYDVIWTATDASGNTATCTTQIQVYYSDIDHLICPSDMIVFASEDACGNNIEIPLPITNLPAVINDFTESLDASGYYPVGNYNIIWSGMNGENNLMQCSTQVTVIDTIAPIIVCQTDTIIQTSPGNNSVFFIPQEPFADDNCIILSTTNNLIDDDSVGIELAIGSYPFVWTAEDASGNIATCQFMVQVVDTIAPEITCQDTVFGYTDIGLCTSTLPFDFPILVEPEDNLTYTNSLDTEGGNNYAFPSGITAVTWNVTDINNNLSSCVVVYSVRDNLPPIVFCEDTLTTYVTGQECTTWVEISTPNYEENCEYSSTTNSINNGFDASGYYEHGDTDLTWYISDVNGNLGTCLTVVHVVDTVAPELICPDTITAALAIGELYTVPDFSSIILPSDECNFISSTWQEIEAGSEVASNISFNFTATDQAGNISTCPIQIEVTYPDIPQLLVCPDSVIFFLNESCEVIVTDQTNIILSQLTELSNAYTVHQNPEPGEYADLENIELWLTDPNGLSSDTCIVPITALDITPPSIISTIEAIIYLNESCEATIPDFSTWVNYQDACSEVVVYSQSPQSGTIVQGAQTINATYWVMDESNNTTQVPLQFQISVVDTIAPQVLPINPMVAYLTEDCELMIPDLTDATVVISCDPVNISQSIPAGIYSPEENFNGVYVNVADENGNDTNIFVQLIPVDTIAPIINALEDIVIAQESGTCSAFFDITSVIDIQECDEVYTIQTLENYNNQYPIGSYDIHYYAMDGSGNFSDTLSVHLVIEDTEEPEFMEVNDTTICQLPFSQPIFVMDCGNLIQVEDNNQPLVSGVNTLSYFYTDGSHLVHFSYQVTLLDSPEYTWTILQPEYCLESDDIAISVEGLADYQLYIDGLEISDNTLTLETLSIGEHTLTLESNWLECNLTESQVFHISDTPSIDIVQDVVQICGESVVLDIIANEEFTWILPENITATSIESNTYEILTATEGAYTIYAQINTSGCQSIDSTIIEFYSPLETPFAGDDQNIYLTSETELTGVFSGPGSHYWTSTDENIAFVDSSSLQTTVQNLMLGENIMIFNVENGICQASDTMVVIVGGLFIPDGFSPNGDGKNDNFVIKGIENVPNASLIIVNRWGQSVYSSIAYKNEWNGKNNSGDILSDDTYFYEIDIRGEKHHGYIILKR